MKKLSAQLIHGTFHPYTLEDQDTAREFCENQIVELSVTGIKKPRSLQQLRMFWACCNQVAMNTDDPNWCTKEKTAEQCKVRLEFTDTSRIIVTPNGTVHIPFRSISMANLSHLEACNFFDRAFKVMANFLKCTVDELTGAATNVA